MGPLLETISKSTRKGFMPVHRPKSWEPAKQGNENQERYRQDCYCNFSDCTHFLVDEPMYKDFQEEEYVNNKFFCNF